MTSEQLDILIRVDAKLDVMKERMDRHENKNEQKFQFVFNKLDSLADKINKVALDAMMEDGKIKENTAVITGRIWTKIAGLSSVSTIMMTVVIEIVKGIFK